MQICQLASWMREGCAPAAPVPPPSELRKQGKVAAVGKGVSTADHVLLHRQRFRKLGHVLIVVSAREKAVREREVRNDGHAAPIAARDASAPSTAAGSEPKAVENPGRLLVQENLTFA